MKVKLMPVIRIAHDCFYASIKRRANFYARMLLIYLLILVYSKTGVRTRKEVRALPKDEWRKFKQAVLELKKTGFYTDLSRLHVAVDTYAHNNPRFLPWHRMFLLYFESLLHMVSGDETITVPYWDWTIDADDPGNSIIFTEEYWGTKECFLVRFPEEHCLVRNSKTIDPFYTKKQIQKLINKRMPYNKFREMLELVPHAIVHLNVGGDDGDMTMMFSTNDPIFWHHHAFIDYIWHKKQRKDLRDGYDGKINSQDVSLDDRLFPFNKSVREVMDNNKNGIKYLDYKAMKIMTLEKRPGIISEEYIKRHKYKKETVREIESFMRGDKQPGIFTRLFRALFW